MKKTRLFASILCGTAMLGVSAHASVFFSETFSYLDGDLTTVSAGNWTAHSGGGAKPIQVNSGMITVQQNAGSGEDLNRSTGATLGVGETIYAGFDLNVTGGNTTVYFAHFLTGGLFDTRLFVTNGAAVGGDYVLGIGSGSAPQSTWASGMTFGNTYRVVMSYEYDTGAGKLWVGAADQSDPSITMTGFANDAVNAFAVRQSTGNSFQVIDNLVVASSFNEALTIPEPTSVALGVMGVFGILMARRRNA